MVIVCGRNRRLQTSLVNEPWTIPVQVHGFVNNMSDWMGASDCIVTKAGPGTIAESLIRELAHFAQWLYSWAGGGQCPVCGG